MLVLWDVHLAAAWVRSSSLEVHLFIVAVHVTTVMWDRGSLAPLLDRKVSGSSAPKKSIDSGPSRSPSSLALFDYTKVPEIQ